MIIRKLNSTLVVLTTFVAAGFVLSSTHHAKAAYIDECPNLITRSAPCPDGTTVAKRAAQFYCATLNFSDGSYHSCCTYRGYNKYCLLQPGDTPSAANKAGGGQDAVLQTIQAYSSCLSFRCQDDGVVLP